MMHLRILGRNRWRLPLAISAVVAAIVAGHAVAMNLPADQAHPLVIATHLYAVVLTLGLLWLGAGVGRTILRPLGLAAESRLEDWLFALAVGLGSIAYGVLALGFAGLLHPLLFAAALSLVAVATRHDLVEAARRTQDGVTALLAARREVRQRRGLFAVTVPMIELLLALLLLQALSPPVGYDALMYHLNGPKRFLELGRLELLPDVQQANMPFTIDLLYLLGLAFGSDEMSQVLHLSFTLVVVMAIFSFGRELLDARTGAFGAMVFLSGTMIAMFAPIPDVDFGLATFDFLAVYAAVRWARSGKRSYLVLSGALVGFALGSKYLGGISALALGIWLVWQLVSQLRDRSMASAIKNLLAYGVPAALIAAPWYIKNVVLLGSPIWPFLAPGEPALNIALSANANLGRELTDYLLLPFRLYVGPAHEYPIARPPILLMLLPLYFYLPKHRLVTGLLALGLVHFLIWTQGAHVIRYLTSALPELCLGTAYVLVQITRSQRLGLLGPRLVAGMLVTGLALSVAGAGVTVAFTRPDRQLIGLESRESYLLRQLPNHSLVARLNREPAAVKGVLLIGDRRAYYVDAPNWVDVSLGAFEALATADDADAARAYLGGKGISHVLVSLPDLEWHAQYDHEGRIAAWWSRFQRTRSAYLVAEASYYDLTLYRVVGENEPVASRTDDRVPGMD